MIYPKSLQPGQKGDTYALEGGRVGSAGVSLGGKSSSEVRARAAHRERRETDETGANNTLKREPLELTVNIATSQEVDRLLGGAKRGKEDTHALYGGRIGIAVLLSLSRRAIGHGCVPPPSRQTPTAAALQHSVRSNTTTSWLPDVLLAMHDPSSEIVRRKRRQLVTYF